MGYYTIVEPRNEWHFPNLGFTLVSRFNRQKEELAEGVRVPLDDRLTLDYKVVMVATPEFLQFVEQHGFPVQDSQFTLSVGADGQSYYVASAPKAETNYPQEFVYAAEQVLTNYLTDPEAVLPDGFQAELASLAGWLWSGISSGVRIQALVKVLNWDEEMFPTRFMRNPGEPADVDEFILQNRWVQR
jgi:hypothetical protein